MVKERTITDSLGNYFYTDKEMCRFHSIPCSSYFNRKYTHPKLSVLEWLALLPYQESRITLIDNHNNVFSIKFICTIYDTS